MKQILIGRFVSGDSPQGEVTVSNHTKEDIGFYSLAKEFTGQ